MAITELAELKNLDELLKNSEPMISNLEDASEKDLSTKDEVSLMEEECNATKNYFE